MKTEPIEIMFIIIMIGMVLCLIVVFWNCARYYNALQEEQIKEILNEESQNPNDQ